MEKVKGDYYYMCVKCGILIKKSSVNINNLNIGFTTNFNHTTRNKNNCNGNLKIVLLVSKKFNAGNPLMIA